MPKSVYWIDLQRFDSKIDKSTWLEMSECLADLGYMVTLVCGYRRQKFTPEGYSLKIKYIPSLHLPGLFRLTLLALSTLWLMRTVQREDIVIVRSGSLPAGLALKLAKRCHVHMDERTVPVERHTVWDRLDDFLYWKLPLTLLKRIPDSYSFITDALRNAVESEFGYEFPDHVIWHSGVNVERFRAMAASAASSDEVGLNLLYIGTVTPNRGLDRVVEAIARLDRGILDDMIFRIVGDGSAVGELRTRVQSLGLSRVVRFEGRVPYDKVPVAIWASDFCICPLPDRPEWNVSSPLKIYEYAACSKPVILTPIYAHTSVFDGREFVLWTRGDSVEDFREAIAAAYARRREFASLAASAWDLVRENLEWRTQAKKLVDHLSKHHRI